MFNALKRASPAAAKILQPAVNEAQALQTTTQPQLPVPGSGPGDLPGGRPPRLQGGGAPPRADFGALRLFSSSASSASGAGGSLAMQLSKLYTAEGARENPSAHKLVGPDTPPSAAQAALQVGGPMHAEFQNVLMNATASGEPVHAAMIGSGTGEDPANMAMTLKDHMWGQCVTGFDTHTPSIDRAKEGITQVLNSPSEDEAVKNAFASIQQQPHDFADWVGAHPEAKESLHVVTSQSTVPYMDDKKFKATLEAMHTALKPGGVAVIGGYGTDNAPGVHPLHLRDGPAMEAFAKAAGFEIAAPTVEIKQGDFHTVQLHLKKKE